MSKRAAEQIPAYPMHKTGGRSANKPLPSLSEFVCEGKALLIQTAFRGWRARCLVHEQKWFDFWYLSDLSGPPVKDTQSLVVGKLFKERGLSPAEFCRRRHFFEHLEIVQVKQIWKPEGGCCGGCGHHCVEIERGYPSDWKFDQWVYFEDTTLSLRFDDDGTETCRIVQFDISPLEITEIGSEVMMCCSGVSGHVVGNAEWVEQDGELGFGETRSFTADELRYELSDGVTKLIFT